MNATQHRALERLADRDPPIMPVRGAANTDSSMAHSTAVALNRRGLIDWTRDGRGRDWAYITDAGRKLAAESEPKK